jgi:hypothetical protein
VAGGTIVVFAAIGRPGFPDLSSRRRALDQTAGKRNCRIARRE